MICAPYGTGTPSFTQDKKFAAIKEFFQFDPAKDYGEDFGKIIFEKPLAVFKPRTVEQLRVFVELASDYQIKITTRGKGNSAFGQAQVHDGIVVDLSHLYINPHYTSREATAVTVPACYTWQQLTEFTKEKNKTVPVTIDNLDLTLAGTLNFGALGGPSYLKGSGADNIVAMEVMTLKGQTFRCSIGENRDLFQAMLCGLGQFGIILSVTVPLETAKAHVNKYLLTYDDIQTFLRDQKFLFDAKVFDHLKGYAKKIDNKWEYLIEAATYFDKEEDPQVQTHLNCLKPDSRDCANTPYWDFINEVTGFVGMLKTANKWDVPHPWYNVLMPERTVEEHITKVLDTSFLTGQEPIVIYPMNAKHFNQPLFVKPESDTFYLVGVLYNTSFEAKDDYPFNEVLERNKALYLEAKEKGGCRYPVDAIPFTTHDWVEHYGDKWGHMLRLKQIYDPQILLGSGFYIFEQEGAKLKNKLGL